MFLGKVKVNGKRKGCEKLLERETVRKGIIISLIALMTLLSMMASIVYRVHATRGSQITVVIGTTVTAYAHINNPNPVAIEVSIKMEIRKDIIRGSDTVKTTLTKTVSVPSGTNFINMGTFKADEQTFESGTGKLRQYFMKAWINDALAHDPKDLATREWVKTTVTNSVSWEGQGEWEA